MAASAYAFLVSLLNTMDEIQIHPRLSTCFDNYQFQSLREKLDFILDFVENHSDAFIREKDGFLVDADITDLLNRIAVVAQTAEDKIELEAADRIRDGPTEKSPNVFNDLQKIIQDMDCIIKEEVIKVKEERQFEDEHLSSTPSMAPPSSSLSTVKTSSVVGFDGYLEQVLDELTGHHSGRRILPIVGMGGIGKTTLARNAYENSLVVYHFDVRVWVTVSQTFSVRDILTQALSCLEKSESETDKTDDQLGEELYKNLSGRRYVVVLDDLWSVGAWEKIQFFFPENHNGSRIVVTTRQQEVVNYFGSSALAVDFLDDSNSWELFCHKTFAQQGCPPQLEEVGRKIVKKCKGLPLAIIVIGGLLGKSPTTQDYWERMEKDKSLVVEYSEVHEIDVSLLIKLWVAEGFIKPNRNQSLEEVAESYLKDLFDRNLLLLVPDLRRYKKFEFCCVHDLVRELCIKVAEKEQFYCVQRDIDRRRQFIVDERTSSFYPQESPTCERPSVMRPLVLCGQKDAPFKSRLLRVLVNDKGYLDTTLQQVNLRFLSHLSISPLRPILSSISLCWSLQTLVLDIVGSVVLSEIWKMPQLRHIEMSPASQMHLPDPAPSDAAFILQNLQTLVGVGDLNFSKEVCKKIPNIKELKIEYYSNEQCGESWSFNLHNIGCLNKLESLYCCCTRSDLLQKLKLPSSLKELVLWDSNFQCDMAMIASLPHLERLELHGNALVGEEWNCVEEEFRCLRLLLIDGCEDLVRWNADGNSFPVLEKLSLVSLTKLDEIPWSIGDIPTLEDMYVSVCSESASISAFKILEEQHSLGNQDLRLQIRLMHKTRAESWKQALQESGFTSQNLHISGIF